MQDQPSHRPPLVDVLTLRAVLQSAAAGIVTIDSKGLIETANPAAERMFGYTEVELVGRNVSMLMPEPYRQHHDNYIAGYLHTGRANIIGVGREVVGLRRDGSTFPMHLSVGEFVADGERYFTGVIIDISKQRSAEAGLDRQRALFQSIFASMPDPIVLSDMSRHIQLVNPAFTRVFGFGPNEVKGKPTTAFYASQGEWARHGKLGYGVESETELKSYVLKFRRRDGDVFPGAAVRTVISDASGEKLGFLEVVRDVSDDLRREAALMQASRMEAIGQLTGGIAHDFNNILTVILGNLELLEMKLTDQGQLALAREAQEASEMGARLTDRLLTFGRRQHLETERINLNEFVLGITDLLNRAIGEDIDLSTSLASELWLTEVDPGQVENAVLNLAINARDAMPGGGRLFIETRNVKLDGEAVALTPELQPGEYVVLSVSDTGHGMPPDVRARAFEPFFSTKGPGKGSGLGLATIYGFAKQSGGHATIYSEIGNGTIVNLYLPRSRSSEEEAGKGGDAHAVQIQPAQAETILVVEDDDRLRKLTVTRLESLGYRVREARNGVEALDAMRADSRVDLVFTDLVMPGGMSGIDLLREMQAVYPRARVLLTSGYAEELVSSVGIEDNFVRLLRKPYRQSDLAIAIRQALE